MRKQRLSTSVLLMIVLLFSVACSANSTTESATPVTSQHTPTVSLNTDTTPSNVLRVGLGELDYPPFYFEEDGQFYGAAVEIAQHIAQDLGYELEFRRYPWARVQNMLQTGHLDLMILYFKTPEREKDVIYTDMPHIYEASYLFTAKETNIPYTGSLQGLDSYTFGNVRGYSHGTEYDNAEHLNKEIVTDERHLIRLLTNGRIDIAVGNRPAILRYAEQEEVTDKIVFLEPPIDKGPNYFAFSRTRDDAQKLAQEFSAAVEEFVTTDTYREILANYDFAIFE